MITHELLQRFPLTLHDDGTLRVTGSRVLLDVIVRQFRLGASPEHICESYPSLTLRDVYGALFFYLDYTAVVEEYLLRQQNAAEDLRRQIEASPFSGNTPGLRERLLARAAQLEGESFSK
ncbi:MAG: DUF433 domain-containing protein [Blastocatellia bacterium]